MASLQIALVVLVYMVTGVQESAERVQEFVSELRNAEVCG